MSRKGENIYKRKDGRWEGRYIKGRDQKNKAIYGYVYGKTYGEVKQKKQEALNSIELNLKEHLYSNWLDTWLEMQREHIKESTYTTYFLHINKHIKPKLGFLHLSKIRNYHIQEFINAKLECGRLDNKGGLSTKSVKEFLNIIKLSLKCAIKNELISNINLDFKIKSNRTEFILLHNDENEQLINHLKQSEDKISHGILLMMSTGIRIGELCALQNKDIDFTNKSIIINKTLQRIPDILGNNKTKIIIQTAKSNKSNRIIPLPESIMKYLSVDKNDNSYFLTQSSKYLEPRTFRYKFKSIIKKLHLTEVTVHSLRHQFATQCIELGFDYNCLSEILGHASPSTTMNLYVHSKNEYKRKCMNKFNL